MLDPSCANSSNSKKSATNAFWCPSSLVIKGLPLIHYITRANTSSRMQCIFLQKWQTRWGGSGASSRPSALLSLWFAIDNNNNHIRVQSQVTQNDSCLSKFAFEIRQLLRHQPKKSTNKGLGLLFRHPIAWPTCIRVQCVQSIRPCEMFTWLEVIVPA